MIFPTLHLNGTGPDMLIDGYSEAMTKVREAQKAIGNIEFHARDYYVQDNDGAAWQQARIEHASRINRLEAVLMELQEIAINVLDQKAERERRRN